MEYQTYLFRNERNTLNQAQVVHRAFMKASQIDEAHRFALKVIVGPLNKAGLYQTLLNKCLPPICETEDRQIRVEAPGQTGKQYHHIGQYETALSYLKQLLAIRQKIGDTAGLCPTLFNMGHIYRQRNEQNEALSAWVTVYGLAKPMGLAQAFEALERLAGQLNMDGGLAAWERLAQQMEKTG